LIHRRAAEHALPGHSARLHKLDLPQLGFSQLCLQILPQGDFRAVLVSNELQAQLHLPKDPPVWQICRPGTPSGRASYLSGHLC
jgi:hypothetical protein